MNVTTAPNFDKGSRKRKSKLPKRYNSDDFLCDFNTIKKQPEIVSLDLAYVEVSKHREVDDERTDLLKDTQDLKDESLESEKIEKMELDTKMESQTELYPDDSVDVKAGVPSLVSLTLAQIRYNSLSQPDCSIPVEKATLAQIRYNSLSQPDCSIPVEKAKPVRSHVCDVCGKTYPYLSYLKKHRVKSHQDKIACKTCNEVFSDLSELSEHKKTHKMKPPFDCTDCQKSFKDAQTLRNHKKTHECLTIRKKKTGIVCSHCGKEFLETRHLEVHFRLHTGERPFSCEICFKSFTGKGGLMEHMKTHTGEKPHTCSQCEKSFCSTSKLKVHMRTHTGERPYTCSYCGKGFMESGKLKRHLRIHTGEQPYKCEVCGRGFNVITNLATHMIIHTNTKPFVCQVCGKGFAQKTNMVVHMKIHNENKDRKRARNKVHADKRVKNSEGQNPSTDWNNGRVPSDIGNIKQIQMLVYNDENELDSGDSMVMLGGGDKDRLPSSNDNQSVSDGTVIKTEINEYGDSEIGTDGLGHFVTPKVEPLDDGYEDSLLFSSEANIDFNSTSEDLHSQMDVLESKVEPMCAIHNRIDDFLVKVKTEPLDDQLLLDDDETCIHLNSEYEQTCKENSESTDII